MSNCDVQISECTKYRSILLSNQFYTPYRLEQLRLILMTSGKVESCYCNPSKLSLMVLFKQDQEFDIDEFVNQCIDQFYRSYESFLYTILGTNTYDFFSKIRLRLYYYLLKFNKNTVSINFV